MRDKTVKDVMTPIESVYMLEVSGTINRKIVKEVGGWSHFASLARSSSSPIVPSYSCCRSDISRIFGADIW